MKQGPHGVRQYAPMLWGLECGEHRRKPLDDGSSSKLSLQFLVDVAMILSFLSSSIIHLAVLEATVSLGCLLVGTS